MTSPSRSSQHLALVFAAAGLGCDATPRSESSPPSPPAAAPSAPVAVEEPATTPGDATSDEAPPVEAPAQAASSRPKDWPAPLPWADAVALPYADYVKPEASAAGDDRVHLTLAAAPLGELVAPWREAFAAAGFAEVDPCALDEAAATFACTYRSADRLATLDLAPSNGSSEYTNLAMHLLPPGHAPLTELPGRCVKPPEHARQVVVRASGIGHDGESYHGATRWSVGTHVTIDLDGDGQGEVLAPHRRSRACPWETPHDLYIMRGECGHKVGTITGFITHATAIAPFKAGLRELTTESTWADYSATPTGADDEARRRELAAERADKDGRPRIDLVPTHHTRTRSYHFDGAALRRDSDHDAVGRCHHCATSHCSSQ
ncbi:MAG: hypothetical protein R3A79_24690 [Nannocystaceae bacterium]